MEKFIGGVVDTGNDTSEQFIAGVYNTGYKIFPWCRWYRSEITKSLKFIGGVNETADKFFGGVNSGALGTLIYEKNQKSKISCQIPFN